MTINEAVRTFTDLHDGDDARFYAVAESVLAYQRRRNPVYNRYCKALSERGSLPPFLPVRAFKRAAVTTFPAEEAERVFESSRTGRGAPSRHYIRHLSVYDRSACCQFEREFGAGPFLFASYLPGYAEAGSTSSLLYMVERLIHRYGHPASRSFLEAPDTLRMLAAQSEKEEVPLLVFGAAFGLLDLVERYEWALPAGSVVVETGGMKTHQREVERADLHRTLADGFGVPAEAVRSEYGMCELLSQCYSDGDGVFRTPAWVRAWVVDPNRPFEPLQDGVPGALAVLDLANVFSASALLTEDRVVRRREGFEVLGRLNGAEMRGCNFLLEHV